VPTSAIFLQAGARPWGRGGQIVARQVRLRGSAAPLTGRLFDDRGNRMSPTQANKRGVRYRYYLSHAILQNRKAEAGSVARVPAPEIDRQRPRAPESMGEAELPTTLAESELIERHVARVIVKPQALEVCLIPACETSAQAEDPSLQDRLLAARRRPRSRSHGPHQASRP
jgi:site-specific DNA recombinase